MNKYAVAYISFFDNVLKHKITLATDPFAAAINYLVLSGTLDNQCIDSLLEHPGFKTNPRSLEVLNCILFDMESAISVIEV